MSNAPYVVTGCDVDGTVHPRLEITDLAAHPLQFSLFIRALTNISVRTYEDKGSTAPSWEQVGGIHGMPYKEWSGDVTSSLNPTDDKPEPWLGYCHHQSALFPTWHRISLLLTEQAISREAFNIVAKIAEDPTYPKEIVTQWQTAAQELRYPFWDWTREAALEGIPKVFQTTNIDIAKLSNEGTSQTEPVKNPLAGYDLQKLNEQFEVMDPNTPDENKRFPVWTRTCRWPKDDDAPSDQYDRLTSALNGDGSGSYPGLNVLCENVASLFSAPLEDYQNASNWWDHFSTTKPQSPRPQLAMPAPLEQPHNKIHLAIGGRGHMAYNEYASFDPIFFMHHCNIDRIYAFWEYIYPKYWMGTGYINKEGVKESFINTGGTWTEPMNAKINETSDLTPFRKNNDSYWNSQECRNTSQGGRNQFYTYPPIVYQNVVVDISKTPSPDDLDTYRGALQHHWKLSTLNNTNQERLAELKEMIKLVDPNMIVPFDNATILNNYRHFVVEVKLNHYAFVGSHEVELYIHPDLTQKGTLIGSVAVFSRLNPQLCANCVNRQASGNTDHRGQVVIPPQAIVGLAEKYRHTSIDDLALSVLESLSARVITPDGKPLAAAGPGGASKGDSDTIYGLDAISHVHLAEVRAPRLTLYSAAAVKRPGPVGAVDYTDWQDHGVVKHHQWAELPRASIQI